MQSCWQENASLRPTFSTLQSKFNDILLNLGNESYIDFNKIDPSNQCYNHDFQCDQCLDFPDFELDLQDEHPRDVRSNSFSNISSQHTVTSVQRKTSLPQLLSRLIDHRMSRRSSHVGDNDSEKPMSIVLSVSSLQEQWKGESGNDLATGAGEDKNRYIANPYDFMPSTSTELDIDIDQQVARRPTNTIGIEH